MFFEVVDVFSILAGGRVTQAIIQCCFQLVERFSIEVEPFVQDDSCNLLAVPGVHDSRLSSLKLKALFQQDGANLHSERR